MSYTYGMKGAPAVGGGLPGLPGRLPTGESWPINSVYNDSILGYGGVNSTGGSIGGMTYDSSGNLYVVINARLTTGTNVTIVRKSSSLGRVLSEIMLTGGQSGNASSISVSQGLAEVAISFNGGLVLVLDIELKTIIFQGILASTTAGSSVWLRLGYASDGEMFIGFGNSSGFVYGLKLNTAKQIAWSFRYASLGSGGAQVGNFVVSGNDNLLLSGSTSYDYANTFKISKSNGAVLGGSSRQSYYSGSLFRGVYDFVIGEDSAGSVYTASYISSAYESYSSPINVVIRKVNSAGTVIYRYAHQWSVYSLIYGSWDDAFLFGDYLCFAHSGSNGSSYQPAYLYVVHKDNPNTTFAVRTVFAGAFQSGLPIRRIHKLASNGSLLTVGSSAQTPTSSLAGENHPVISTVDLTHSLPTGRQKLAGWSNLSVSWNDVIGSSLYTHGAITGGNSAVTFTLTASSLVSITNAPAATLSYGGLSVGPDRFTITT